MRTFVVVGQTARASDNFSLDDLPSTSGRLDVLLRCLRAALLLSHGIRRDVRVYLVLRGGPSAPQVLRVDGAIAKFLRPDERSLAILVKKALAFKTDPEDTGWVQVRAGITRMHGDLEQVFQDLEPESHYLLERGAPDVRSQRLNLPAAFWLGDHLGLDHETRQELLAHGARPIGVGPVCLHSEDALAVLSNELDRSAGPQE